jgi:putative PIG3 family NAD(P)H quinone oxidoreductase
MNAQTFPDLPKTMRAISHSPGVACRLEEIACPQPGAGEVLIAVRAAGVNRPDLLQKAGLYPPPAGAPQTLGLEVAGEIAALGPGVTDLAVGAPVVALLAGGGYSEYALAPAGSVLPKPSRLSFVEAAGLPETVFTVWANVFESGSLKAGEAFLVHGGASGIGTTAIQMAKAAGATVYATAGDAAKVELCERLGATRAIHYKTEDFEPILRGLGGVDVILDMAAGPYIEKNLNILNLGGRLVFIAFLQGSSAQIDFMRVMLKRLTITGSTLRARPVEEKARLAKAVAAHVWPWVEAGLVSPVIDQVFPLAQAEEALARMAAGSHAGKIILTP